MENSDQNVPPGWARGFGNFHMVLYAVGLSLPIRFLPSYRHELFKMEEICRRKLWLFALRVLLACYAIATIVPESRQMLKRWYTGVTGDHSEFPRITAVLSTLATIQAVPRQDSPFGQIGMRCLIILLLHNSVWFFKTFLYSDYWIKPDMIDASPLELCRAADGDDKAPRFDRGECSLMVPITCILYTCVLGRIAITHASCLEVLGCMIAWQSFKQLLHFYANAHSLVAAAFMFLKASSDVLLFVGFVGVLMYACKRIGVSAAVIPMQLDNNQAPCFLSLVQRAARWMTGRLMLHNACLVAVQLWLAYYAVQFLCHQVQHNFCAIRITLSAAYTDMFSDRLVVTTVGCDQDQSAQLMQQVALEPNKTLSVSESICITWWALTSGLQCPVAPQG